VKLIKNLKASIRLSIIAFIAILNTSYGAQTIVKMDTDYGDIYLKLYDDQAPITVANFLSYVQSGEYDKTIFHRLVPGFIVQSGGYKITGQQVRRHLG
jgi:hypothetical protein